MPKYKDMTGQQFGKLTVIEYVGTSKKGSALWKCKCECGNVIVTSRHKLMNGDARSCGCAKTQDLTGKTFGRLTVIRKYGKDARNEYIWECKCSCGNTTYVQTSRLKSGNTVSCGCWREERKYKHGLHKSKIYRKYHDMIDRCYNKNNVNYNNYGNKNVKVCDEWYTPWDSSIGFMNFYKWAMENGYHDGLTIERNDPFGDYCPENCSLIPMKEQVKNKRDTHRIWDGEEYLTHRDLERKYKLPRNFVKIRLSCGDIYDQIIHFAKHREWITKDKNGIWRNKEGWQRILKHYEQDKEEERLNKLNRGEDNE